VKAALVTAALAAPPGAPPVLSRHWKFTPFLAVPIRLASREGPSRDSRIITPALDQSLVLVGLPRIFAVTWKSPFTSWDPKKRRSALSQISPPEPEIVKTPVAASTASAPWSREFSRLMSQVVRLAGLVFGVALMEVAYPSTFVPP